MAQSEQNNPASLEGAQCLTCGYDLRALDIDGSCPECGTSIELSVRGDLLSLADPSWVAKLARGQSLLVFGIRLILIAIVAGIVVSFLIGIAKGLGFGSGASTWTFIIMFWFFGIGFGVGGIFASVGCTLVTTQDPRDGLTESKWSNREVARIALFAIYVSIVFCYICSFTLNIFPAMSKAPQLYAGFVLLLLGACFTVSLVSCLSWLADLAVRVPNHDLRKRILKSKRFYLWVVPVFTIVIALLPAYSTPPAGGLAGKVIRFMLLNLIPLVFVFAILIESNRLYLIFFEYRKAFRKCAEEAAEESEVSLN